MAGLIVDGGDIPLRYFEKRSYDLTFKVVGPRLSFRDLYEGLCEILHEDDITDIGKVDSNTYNVTVSSPEAADLLNMYGNIKVRDRKYQLISISKQVFEFRVHWLPSYIKDSFLEDFFSRFGKVISVFREAVAFGPNSTKRTSVRKIMIETDELKKRSLPYVVTFTGGYTALITVPGRPPLCLKCKTIGHLRKDCVPQGTTYAARARGGEASGRASGDGGQGGSSGGGNSSSDDVTNGETNTDTGVSGGDTSDTSGTIGGATGGDTGGATGVGADGVSGGDAGVGVQGDSSEDQALDFSGYLSHSTGSTIPPNQEKRTADEVSDDDSQMTTDEMEWLKGGKRLKGKP